MIQCITCKEMKEKKDFKTKRGNQCFICIAKWHHDHRLKKKLNVDYIIQDYVRSARNREIYFADDDVELLKNKLYLSCYFCNLSPNLNESLNGLDRIDNDHGYTDQNTITACSTCNYMRRCCSIDLFIENVRNVYNYISY